jgi:hypothetical protein
MAETFFKEQFGNIKKIKVCTTTADLNFDTYTEPGTYEIYEDMGSGQNRIYFLTVDKSVSGACLKQTRIHCGIVDARQTNTAGAWTEWTAITGGGGGSADLSNYYTKDETDNLFGEYIPPLENDINALYEQVGSIDTALDELHAYAQALAGGDA